MIVLDTNVLSELARPTPSPVVIDWVDQQASADLVITALTAAEIRAGIALLPDGHRKRTIAQRMEVLLTETFAGYVLAFDTESAVHYADVVASRAHAGRPIGAIDAQIAALCRQYQSSLATRNISDFTGVGIELINPWQEGKEPT